MCYSRLKVMFVVMNKCRGFFQFNIMKRTWFCILAQYSFALQVSTEVIQKDALVETCTLCNYPPGVGWSLWHPCEVQAGGWLTQLRPWGLLGPDECQLAPTPVVRARVKKLAKFALLRTALSEAVSY